MFLKKDSFFDLKAMATSPSKAPYPHVAHGTTLVDRINLAMHLRRYLKMIGGRWWLLVVCAIGGLGINAYRAFQRPNLYKAYSILSIPQKVAIQNGKAPVLEVYDKIYESRLAEMRNPAVLKKTEEAVAKIYAPPVPPGYSTAAELGSAASFNLVVTSTDFNYALAFSTNWLKQVINYREERRIQLYGRAALREREELKREEDKLAKLRAQKAQFQLKHQIASSKEAGISAQRQYENLVAEKGQVTKDRQLLESTTAKKIAEGALSDFGSAPKPVSNASAAPTRDASAPGTLNDPFEKFRNNSSYKDLSLQLQAKRTELAKLSPLLKPKHPLMIQLEGAIASLDQQIKFELDYIESSRAALLESLRQKELNYEPLLAQQLKSAQENSSIQDSYQRLLDDIEQQQQVVATLTRTISSIDRGTGSDAEENYEVPAQGIGDANVPIWGNPQRKSMILMGFMVGLATGIALAYFLQRLDDRLELAEDIEEVLGEPVLGQIPMVDSGSNKDGFLLITKLSQHNMFSESIRGVRSAIMLGSDGGLKQLLLVSSAVPGDGKTTFTVNFAATLAIAGYKVLLIDADLRRGNVHFYFKAEKDGGMSELLSGEVHWTDVVRQTEVKSLSIITTGRIPPNPGELLISPITKEFLAEARMEYDYIIVDCPPLTAIDDTFSLANIADGLLFVVRAGQTSMKFAKNALQAVRHRGAKIHGIVLNCITADNPYYYYSNYYHAYYNKDQISQQSLAEAPRPASKMAPRRRQPLKAGSIEAAATAHAGESASRSDLARKELSKAQEFKARRAAQRRAHSGSTPETGETAPTQDPAPEDKNAAV